MARRPQPRQQQAHTGGTPGPRQQIIFTNLPKMNTRVMRQNLSENEAAWIENLQPIAGNFLRIVPAPLFPLAELPTKIVTRMFHTAILSNPANPNSPLVDYVIFFATDGSATAVRADTGDSIQFAPPGTFSTTPDMTTWINERILIIDPIAGYCDWDGVTFTQGTTPTLGTTIAVFAGRVWIAHRRTLTWTGTVGYNDTNPANAAGDTTLTDADLVHEITALRALNNYLYIFGDQSVKFIGNVTIANPPAGTVGVSTTEFQIVTLTSDVGCPFPMSILSYNRLVMFCNISGVWAIIGASVQKVSDDLDGLFTRVDFSQEPCAALNDLNNIHCYLLLLKYDDPDNNFVFGVSPQFGFHPRSVIAVFQNRNWFLVRQGDNLISITALPLAETNEWETMGSSGGDLTQLLINEDAPVTYILKTPLSAHNSIIIAKQTIRAGLALSALEPQEVNFIMESETSFNPYKLFAGRDIIWRNAAHDIITFVNNQPEEINFKTSPRFMVPYHSMEAYGRVLGCTVWGTSKNMALNAALIEYVDADLWGEGPPAPQ